MYIALAYLDTKPRDKTLEERARLYAEAVRGRDVLVRDLLAAGWQKTRIADALGMGRPTINRIMGARYPQNHGNGYVTLPRVKGNVSHETKSPELLTVPGTMIECHS